MYYVSNFSKLGMYGKFPSSIWEHTIVFNAVVCRILCFESSKGDQRLGAEFPLTLKNKVVRKETTQFPKKKGLISEKKIGLLPKETWSYWRGLWCFLLRFVDKAINRCYYWIFFYSFYIQQLNCFLYFYYCVPNMSSCFISSWYKLNFEISLFFSLHV